MQQFVIPQFIDVEDKVIGSITVRQFIILLSGGLLVFLAYKLSDFTLFVTQGLIIFALSGVLAFLKINGQPFHYFILNLIQTLRRPNLQVWDKTLTKEMLKQYLRSSSAEEVETGKLVRPKSPVSTSRLSELSLIVDTGGVYQGND